MINSAVEEQSYLYDVLIKVRRRKLLITVTTIGLFVVLALGVQLLPRKYTTAAKVEVEAQTPHAVQSTQDILHDLPFDDSTMGTEVSLIESDPLYLDVVKKFGLVKNPEFNPNLKRSIVRDLTSRLHIIIEKVIPEDDPEAAFDVAGKELADTMVELRKHVKVSQVTRSRMIEITVTSKNNRTAEAVANAISDLYVANHLDYRAQISNRAHSFVTQRLDELQRSAGMASQAVETFRSENGLMSGKDSTILQEQVTSLSNQLLAAQAKQAMAESELTAARHVNPEQLPRVLSSEAVARLRDQESQIASRRAFVVTTYGENNAVVTPLTNQLRTIRAQIASESQRALQELVENANSAKLAVATLTAQLDGLKSQMTNTDAARAHLATLMDEAQTQRTLYTTFLQRSKETDEALQFPATSVRVAAHALIPMKASFPNNMIMLPGALFLSCVTAIGFGIWRESRRKGVVSRTEIETLVPSLGMLPILRRTTRAQFEDVLEDLWNRLSYRHPHVILVTSALPAEGKSLVARSIVQTARKRRVNALLVDADMRSKFTRRRIDTRAGLGDVLSGQVAVADAIDEQDSVPMLPVGNVSDHPTRLLSLPNFEQMLDLLKLQYALIVVDSPPSLIGGDAAKLAQLADTTVMVVRWNSTTPQEISTALGQLRLTVADGKLAGILLNMVNPRLAGRYDPNDALLLSNLYGRR